jgi:ADP-ribose pyrophosphatase
VYRGRVVDLGVEEVVLPDGRSLSLEVVRHPGGAAAAAIDTEGRVCLLRQYRHAAGGWLWEVPAGKLDPGEEPLATARRELREEAGVSAGAWRSLGEVVTAPGFCDEVIHLFLATDLAIAPAPPELHEVLEVHWLALDDALRRAVEGEIRDAKTVAALFRARESLRP